MSVDERRIYGWSSSNMRGETKENDKKIRGKLETASIKKRGGVPKYDGMTI